MAPLRVVASACLVLCACGDPLVDASYRGVPMLTMKGAVTGAPADFDEKGPVFRGAIFWFPKGTRAIASPSELSEQPSTGREFELSTSFTWNLFEPPTDTQLFETSSGARYGLGQALLYRDEDADGRLGPGEQPIGGSASSWLLYAPESLSDVDSPISGPVPAGFHLLSAPLLCAPLQAPATSQTDCGVPLGQPCKTSADCGGGTCLLREPRLFPGGACAIPEPPPSGCRPAQGALFHDFRNHDRGWWLKSCERDADCGRDFPYMCDLNRGACLPNAYVQLDVSDRFTHRSACRFGSQDGTRPPGWDGGLP